MPKLKSLLNNKEVIEVKANEVDTNLSLGYWELIEEDVDVIEPKYDKKSSKTDKE